MPNGSQGSITFEDTDRLSDQFAVYLREVAGFKAGDRVAIQMPNCLAYPIAVFGTLKAGLVMANTNPLYTTAEMTHQFTDSGAVGLIVIDLFATKVAEVLPKTSITDRCRRRHFGSVAAAQALPDQRRPEVREEDDPADHLRAHDDDAGARRRAPIASRPAPTRRSTRSRSTHDSIAALQYTGGTTGVAKGAVLTHGNLVANTIQGLEMWKPFLRLGEEVMLTALPLYHIFAFTANLMIFYLAGGRNVLVPSPRPLSNLKTVMTHRTDHVVHRRQHAVRGTDARIVVQERNGLDAARIGRRRHGARAGDRRALGSDDEDADLPGLRPDRNLAGRDAQSVSASEARSDRRADSRAPTCASSTPTGRDVAFGEVGELWVKGPQVMQGYWQRPDETARVLRDGWLATGDIAKMDDDGYIQIVDRKKDMILVSGFNVYPNEVEAVLLAHPGVTDAAVVGVPDDEVRRDRRRVRDEEGSVADRGRRAAALQAVADRTTRCRASSSSRTTCRSRTSARCCARICATTRSRRISRQDRFDEPVSPKRRAGRREGGWITFVIRWSAWRSAVPA